MMTLFRIIIIVIFMFSTIGSWAFIQGGIDGIIADKADRVFTVFVALCGFILGATFPRHFMD